MTELEEEEFVHKVTAKLIDDNILFPFLDGITVDENSSKKDLKDLITIYKGQVSSLYAYILHLKRPKSKNKDKNYIYVMIDHNTGYYKIGRSAEPKKRERTLQSEKPTIEMLFCVKSDEKEEGHLHLLFKDKRIRGEWFDLTTKDLGKIKEYLS